MRRRVTEAYVARLAGELGSRDLAIVGTLDRVRVATAEHLKRLHFIAGTPAANARQAQRRLRQLGERRVLAELDERRVGGPVSGSTHAVYALDVAGQHLASAAGPAGGRRLRRPWTPGVTFLSHALAVTELYVRLVERARTDGGELVAFDAEPACWRSFSRLGGHSWLKPDCFVRYAAGELEHFSFVEVDRATQSRTALAGKLAVYRRFFQTGREQERWGLFPQVVITTPSEERKSVVVDVVAAQPPATWPLFRVVTFDDAVAAVTREAT